jgi:cytochrome P450
MTASEPLERAISYLVDDPYPWYATMREERLVAYTQPEMPYARMFRLSRHADVQAVLRDSRFGLEGVQQGRAKVIGSGALARSYGLWFLFMDPPNHTRLRALVSKAFTPRTIEGLRKRIQTVVDTLLDRQEGNPTFNLIADYAYQVPVLVICEMLGMPDTDRARFTQWSTAIARGLDNLNLIDPALVMQGDEAAEGLSNYFHELIGRRRHRPGNDLLSGLIAAEEAGDRLTEDELVATCMLLFFAGHETTVNLIGNGMLALLRHPSELQRLRAEPALIGGAIEEVLRFDSPVQRTSRVVLADAEVNELRFERGDRVNVLLGAANRDPRQFPDPDRLDITRQNARQHLSFAAGIHYCVGASLARLETQLAIATLLRRAPGLRISQTPRWRKSIMLRGLSSLEVAWS